MARRADEIQTCMNTHINLSSTGRLLLLDHIALMLIIQELDNRDPTISVVHIIAKSGCVNYS